MLDALSALLDESLLQRDESADDEPRLTMLETIREFALEMLAASGEEEAVRDAHAAYFLALAREAEGHLEGPDQAVWFARLDREHSNLQAALRWLVGRGQVESGLAMVEALTWFWIVRGHMTEGRARLAGLLASPDLAAPVALRARALQFAGTLAFYQSDLAAARAHHEQSLAIWRAVGDRAGLASILASLGGVVVTLGDHEDARALYEESERVADEIGDVSGVLNALHALASLAHDRKDYQQARALYQRCYRVYRQRGEWPYAAFALHNLGVVAQDQGDHAAARLLYERSVAMRGRFGDRLGAALTLVNLGSLATLQGDYQAAHAALAESMAIRQDLGDGGGIALVLERFADVAEAAGGPERAARMLGAAAGLRREFDVPLQPAARALQQERLARLEAALGRAALAAAVAEGRALALDQAVAYALAGRPGG